MTAKNSLNVEVDDVESILLDEFAALFDVFAHQRGEDSLGFDNVLHANFEQRASLCVHGGGPKLLGIHFAQSLEARDSEVLLGVFENIAEQRRSVFLGDLVAIVGNGKRGLVE